MKVKITIGTDNGKKGAVVIDTKDLPKKYTACHGSIGISAEAIKEEKSVGKNCAFDS